MSMAGSNRETLAGHPPLGSRLRKPVQPLVGFQTMQVELEVNGNRYRVDVPAAEPLSAVLRDRLELTGTKVACGEGTCGSCTVLVDDRPGLSRPTLTPPRHGAAGPPAPAASHPPHPPP